MRGIWLLAGILCFSATEAWAQKRVPTLGVGTGYNLLWFPESSIDGLAISGNVRVPVSSRLDLEPNINFGYSNDTQDFGGGRVTNIDHVWSVGANVIAAKRQGLVRPYGGGGGSVVTTRSTYETTIVNGQSSSRIFRSRNRSDLVVAAEGVAGVDVSLGRSVAVFGEARVEALLVSGAAVNFWYLAGVRLPLR